MDRFKVGDLVRLRSSLYPAVAGLVVRVQYDHPQECLNLIDVYWLNTVKVRNHYLPEDLLALRLPPGEIE